MISSHEPNIL